MKTEHLKQLREAFKQTTRGLWCSISNDDQWGLVCNGDLVAQGMAMGDAYLVDVMHAHYLPLIDEVERLQQENYRLKQEEEVLTLSLATSKNEAAYWHDLYNTAIKATEKLVDDLTRTQT